MKPSNCRQCFLNRHHSAVDNIATLSSLASEGLSSLWARLSKLLAKWGSEPYLVSQLNMGKLAYLKIPNAFN